MISTTTSKPCKKPSAVEKLREEIEDYPLVSPSPVLIAEALVEVSDKLDGLRRFVFATAPRRAPERKT